MIFRFEDPLFLLLLGAVPVLAWWYVVRGRKSRGSLTHPDVVGLGRADRRQGRWLQHVPAALRGLALVCLIVAFARPQTGVTGENVVTEGIDIVLALDISSSMLAEDLTPNRIEAAKAVAADFAGGRGNDRIGLVIFAGKAFTQAPLTLDHSVVVSLIGELEVGMIEDGTAVGMGLATAVKRLQASEAASKGGGAAHRRSQQPGRDRSGDGGAGGPGLGRARVHDRCGVAGHGPGAYHRPLWQPPLRHHPG